MTNIFNVTGVNII